MSWQSQWIAILTASLVRPLALAAAAWLILRVLRVRHPASQHAVWTVVLLGMLLLPVASVLSPHWNLPVRPPTRDAAVEAPAAAAVTVAPPGRADPVTPVPRPSLETVALWCYFAGLLAMVVYRAVGTALVWRVVSRSKPLRARRLRESGYVLAPVVVGALRPAVLLPEEWHSWDAKTRRAVLLHEFAHLRRRDPLVSAISRLARCVFWFHPLAWWLARKISNLAELACDARVLERMQDPAGYSRILLRFAGAVNGAGHRAALPGLAMAPGSGIGRRVDQVFELAGGAPRKLARPGRLLVLVGVPVICLAATLGFGDRTTIVPHHPALPLLLAQSTQAARPAPGPGYLSAIGNVAASNTVRIRPTLDGQLLSIEFKEGDLVHAGQTLATIDPRPYETRLAEAEGQLFQDEALLNNAATEVARYQKLVAQNAIQSEQLDAPKAAVAQLQGKIRSDQAGVAAAKLQLSYTHIIAPITGVAGLLQVSPGNWIRAADSTGIVTINQLQPISVLFAIPESSLPPVRASLAEGGNPVVEAWSRDASTRIATGRLTATDNQIDPETGTLTLKAVFDNQNGALMPGQFVNVRLFLTAR